MREPSVEIGGHIGFTGTRKGMTEAQLKTLTALLTIEQVRGFHTFHHGCEEHADREAAKIARALGYRVVGHPGYKIVDGQPALLSGGVESCDELCPFLPYPQRNKAIVDASQLLYAAPRGYVELRRSGTWATVRYARKTMVEHPRIWFTIWPDGEIAQPLVLGRSAS